MITSGLDHLLNVWDMRTLKQLGSVRLSSGAISLAFSQKNMIAAGLKNQVVVLSSDLIKTNTNVSLLGNVIVDEGMIENIGGCYFINLLKDRK